MNTRRKIHAGLGLALALVAVPASAGAAEASADDGSVGEAALASTFQPGIRCTVSGATSTGREWAMLVIKRERGPEVFCSRVRTGGEAPADFPSCYERKWELGCTVIID